MKLDFKRIIEKWIPQNTKVLDLGCGDGDLLEHLIDSKNVNGFGIEIDISKANEVLDWVPKYSNLNTIIDSAWVWYNSNTYRGLSNAK